MRKTGSTWRIATPSEEDRATGNMRKKFGENRPRGFRVMRADRQTDKQADILITILRNPAEAKYTEPITHSC